MNASPNLVAVLWPLFALPVDAEPSLKVSCLRRLMWPARIKLSFFVSTAEIADFLFVLFCTQRSKSIGTKTNDSSSAEEPSGSDVPSSATSHQDVTVALQEKLSALTEENERDRKKLSLLEQEMEWLRSRNRTIAQLEKVCEVEDKKIAAHSNELVNNLELATSIKDGTICGGRNVFATHLIHCLTETAKM